MKDSLQKNWWVLTLNGVIAILIGGLAIFASDSLMKTVSTFLGLLILVGGLLLLLGAYDLKRKKADYALMLTEGVVAGIVGVLIMIFPMQTVKIFFIFIGVWAILIGLMQVYMAIVMRSILENNYILIIGGFLLAGIGLFLLLRPEMVAGVFLQIVGGVVVVLGILLIYYSFIIRHAIKEIEAPNKS